MMSSKKDTKSSSTQSSTLAKPYPPNLPTYYTPSELPMSYSIVPNPSRTAGFLLILTDRSGARKEIQCHNRATAEYEARLLKAKRNR